MNEQGTTGLHFRDLPPVFARLLGFLAGSAAQRLGRCPIAPEGRAPVLRRARLGAWKAMPSSMKRGWRMAQRQDGREEPPVLIVPGFMGPSLLLYPLAAFLRLHGRKADQLHTFPALDGVVEHAQRIARAVDRLLAETGARQIDLVAHSMGGLAGRYYLRRLGGAAKVRRFITIATPHHGTHWAHLHLTQSLKDMRPGSPLLKELSEGGPVPGVRCVTIRAGWDQIVWPREHARWGEHAPDHVLPWAEHWAVQADPRTLALVLTSLEAPDEQVPEGTVGLEQANEENLAAAAEPFAPAGPGADGPTSQVDEAAV
jgi:pimeloyl-ACP methyl ester carboxylesterase